MVQGGTRLDAEMRRYRCPQNMTSRSRPQTAWIHPVNCAEMRDPSEANADAYGGKYAPVTSPAGARLHGDRMRLTIWFL